MTMTLVRRTVLGSFVLAASAGVFFWIRQHELGFGNGSELSGWLMLAMMVFLVALNWRKRLSFLPIGRVYWWTQLHVYVGLLTLIVFWMHMPAVVPSGPFEIVLGSLFLVVAFSGVFGIAFSRLIPPSLVDAGETVIYERIPGLREQLLEQVQELVGEALEEHGTTALADLYRDKLHAFMIGPRDQVAHALGSDKPLKQWHAELDHVRTELNEAEAGTLEQVRDAVAAKVKLDVQYARRTVLKRWLFLHVPLSYGLFVVLGLHILFVYGYGAA